MAKAFISMPDDFLLKISRLREKTDEIIPKVLEAGSGEVVTYVESNLKAVIGGDTKYPSESTGELVGSLGVSRARVDNDGNYNVKVGFNEPRRKQYKSKRSRSYNAITNAMIANAIEYGKHGQPAKPFLKPAKSASRKKCKEAMIAKLEEEIERL